MIVIAMIVFSRCQKNARGHPFPTHSDLNDVPHIFSTQVEPVHGTYAQNGSRVTQFANACNIFVLYNAFVTPSRSLRGVV